MTAAESSPRHHRRIRLPFALDLAGSVGALRRGRGDATCRVSPTEVWRSSRVPGGPATLHLRLTGQHLEAEAWGEGATAMLDAVPALVGLHDDTSGFNPTDDLVARLWRTFGRRRIVRSLAITDALVSSILEQRVTTMEARRAQRQLVARWGEPAPGPGGLRLAPDPEVLAVLPYYDLHPLGVERKRADAIRRVAAEAGRLDALVALPVPEAHQRLTRTVGVGPWTAAEVALVALGDADAVPIGDIHLPSDVTYALTGTAVRSDDAMLEALAPYAGHRGRVIRLLGAAAIHAPRRAPRYSPRDTRNA